MRKLLIGCVALTLLPGCGAGQVSGSDNSSGGSVASSGGSGSAGGSGGSVSSTGGSSGTAATTGGSAGSSTSGGSGGQPVINMPGVGSDKAAQLVTKLGYPTTPFLIGMGNDGDGVYSLGAKVDLHYIYLTSGWSDWNPDGSYADGAALPAFNAGIVPMFTYYGMAAWGDGNFWIGQDAGAMASYFGELKVLFKRLNDLDKPAVVHFEPDFWGYVLGAKNQGVSTDPANLPAAVSGEGGQYCSGLPETFGGIGQCIIKIARGMAPKVAVGFQASTWGGTTEDTIDFFIKSGAQDSDFLAVETLDRDAGCFEAGVDPACQRAGDHWYWSDSDYADHLAWVKALHDGIGVPILWWQMPFGVPSDTPGGSAEHYRDNRVQYVFSHIQQFIDAGGVGAAWGCGAGNQTSWLTDGDQFKNAVLGYNANPFYLP